MAKIDYIKKRKNHDKITHGFSHTKEYKTWARIKQKCLNFNDSKYKYYGGRGITICDEWKNSPEIFLKDMGECPEGYSIERINNNKEYSKNNCKWASSKEQSLNRRSNFIVEFKGEIKPLKQFCDELDKNYHTIFARIKYYKWSIEKALSK